MIKARSKTVMWVALGALLIVALIFGGFLRSHTPNQALAELAVALQTDDEIAIKKLTTPQGLASLRTLTKHYDRKKLGAMLSAQQKVVPGGHVVNIVVFHLKLESQPATAFFMWTIKGWKLSSIN